MKRLQKQFLALCISVSLCSTTLVGCGNTSEEAVAETEVTTEAQEVTETTQVETTVPVVQTVIVGEVPGSYVNVDRDGQQFEEDVLQLAPVR